MKLLITGANGFVGRAMLDQMSGEHRIYALTRNVDGLAPRNNVEFIQHDFSKPIVKEKFPESIDAVIHLAQSNEYRNFPAGMADMVKVNIAGLVDVLSYAKESGCKHFINFSSGSVYSGTPEIQDEDSILKPQNAYPLTKYISEQITDLYQTYFSTLNLRLFFPYGPGQQGMLIPNIINSVKTGSEIGLQGDDGGLVLCPIFVNDVVKLCQICLAESVSGTMNVGGVEQVSLRQVANEIGSNVRREPVFNIDSSAVPAQFEPSLQRMIDVFGKNRLTTFSEGISKTIKENG